MISTIQNTLQLISWNLRTVSLKLIGGRRLLFIKKLALRIKSAKNTIPAKSIKSEKIRANLRLKMQKTAKKYEKSYVFDEKKSKTSSTSVENVRQIRLFLQNKPNFPHFSPEIDDLTQKQTQNKPNSNPIGQRAENEYNYL